MYAFDYQRPDDLETVLGVLRTGSDPKILAGGQTLLPTLKQRLAQPDILVDLAHVPDLAQITAHENAVRIGAMARHADVAASDLVREAIPALADLAANIGDPAVRNRGTIGGSLANNDPAADYPAACLGLGARLHTSAREIAADDFFLGLFETALAADEVILAVTFPRPARAAYMKFRNPASRYAMAGVFVAQVADGVRVAVTGVGQSGVFRWDAAEAALAAQFTSQALEGLALDPNLILSDIHGGADYRAHLGKVMAMRAVDSLCGG